MMGFNEAEHIQVGPVQLNSAGAGAVKEDRVNVGVAKSVECGAAAETVSGGEGVLWRFSEHRMTRSAVTSPHGTASQQSQFPDLRGSRVLSCDPASWTTMFRPQENWVLG
ncbi:hypothetical protein AXG93_763s1250 [Marchantia polymorpha subsp. ruderalis]|uniref:Uncharacterized protein n=1 Tax=Marchantia polymorpha subsp. ruderalis TaxID=1480154 RepID=A0A176WR59_MARPO|nr:hypothetical protein AXG93_763s1250 [Marchantia polymorpha subsp. ruderalis]